MLEMWLAQSSMRPDGDGKRGKRKPPRTEPGELNDHFPNQIHPLVLAPSIGFFPPLTNRYQ